MKYMVIGILIFGSIVLGWILKNIVWPAIKADPVSNLIMPVRYDQGNERKTGSTI